MPDLRREGCRAGAGLPPQATSAVRIDGAMGATGMTSLELLLLVLLPKKANASQQE